MSLVGRNDALHTAQVALRAKRHVLLWGAPGSGRTAALAAVAEKLGRRGSAYYLLAGHDGVEGIPLTTAAPLLAELELPDRDPLTVYTEAPRLLRSQQAALLIDDVDLVDRGTAALLAQCARAGVPMAFSGPSVTALPRGLTDAVRAAGLDEVHLRPLTTDEVLELAAVQLGDDLDVPSASRLVVAARGLPERVLELVEAGRAGMANGPTGVRLGPGLLTARLRHRVRQETDTLGGDALDLLTLLSAAGRLPRDILDSVAVEELEHADLVRSIVTYGERVDLLPDPVVSATLAEDARPTTWRELRREAAAKLAGHDDAWAAVLTIRDGEPLTDDVLVTAAEVALLEDRVTDALDLLAACSGLGEGSLHTGHTGHAGPVAPLAIRWSLARGAALSRNGAAAEAVPLLQSAARAAAAANDFPLVGRIGHELGVTLAIRGGDPATAVREVEALVATVGVDRMRGLVADLVKWRLMAGLPASDLPGTTDLTATAEQISITLITAMVGGLDGPLDQAHHAVAEGRAALVHGLAPPYTEDLLMLSDYLARCFEGRIDAAAELAKTRRDAALASEHPAVGVWEYAAAEMALHRGFVRHARTLARRAERHLTWADFTGVLETNRALLAALDRRCGQAPSVHLPGPEQRADVKVDLHAARAEAEALLAAQDRAGAAGTLAAAGMRAVAESHAHLGVLAVDEAFLVTPDPGRRKEYAAVLEEHAHRSPFFAALAQRATALIAEDPAALEAAAHSLAANGLPGRAAQAFEAAAARHAERGAQEATRRVRALAAPLLARGVLPWPDGPSSVSLSPRELEIATQAARRVRSREIAEALGLSVRTVDNHLARIFRKLGVTGRDELAAALEPADDSTLAWS